MNYTIPQLNERAARLCGLEVRTDKYGYLVRDDGTHFGTVWSPATDPGDCAVVMEAMEKAGWSIESDGPLGDVKGEYSAIVYKRGQIGGATKEYAKGRWHAVTLAAVRAGEGANA